ncbi:MAG: creatininase family protein [Halobacteriaceae archaeon]
MALDLSQTSWAAKTAGEVRALAERDGSVLVVPVGSIEQHGNHLPVATDTLLADAVVHEGAERVREDLPILVTPPVWSGFSPHHMSFGGTLTLEFEDLLAVLEDVADAGLDNGFDAVLFCNGHGGNKSLVSSAVSTVGDAHPEAEVLALTYFDLAAEWADEVRDSDVGGMAHGGEFETSLVLHLYPELVREDREAPNWDEPYDLGGQDLLVGGPLSVYRPFEEYSDTGAIGAPDLASAEKGAEILTRLADDLEDLFREIHERNA